MNKRNYETLTKIKGDMSELYSRLETLRDDVQSELDQLENADQDEGADGDLLEEEVNELDNAMAQFESAEDTLATLVRA